MHTIQNCYAKPCSKCGDTHHPLLCLKFAEELPQQGAQAKATRQGDPKGMYQYHVPSDEQEDLPLYGPHVEATTHHRWTLEEYWTEFNEKGFNEINEVHEDLPYLTHHNR